jgi:hypothetical protein
MTEGLLKCRFQRWLSEDFTREIGGAAFSGRNWFLPIGAGRKSNTRLIS